MHPTCTPRLADALSGQERLEKPTYEIMRQASEVHRQVRNFAYSIIKPGIKLIDMCEQIENMTRKLVVENGLQVSSLSV